MIARGAAGRGPFPPRAVVQIKALACERPTDLGLPVARLSSAEIARFAVARDIVEAISVTTVWRWLSEDALRPWTYRRRRTEWVATGPSEAVCRASVPPPPVDRAVGGVDGRREAPAGDVRSRPGALDTATIGTRLGSVGKRQASPRKDRWQRYGCQSQGLLRAATQDRTNEHGNRSVSAALDRGRACSVAIDA